MPSGSQPAADDDGSDTRSIKSTTNVHVNHGEDSDAYNEDYTEQGLTGDMRIASRPLYRCIRTIIIATFIIALFTVAAWFLYPNQRPPAGRPAPSPPPSPVPSGKLLIVGDSITQGAEGDYSWRYRLWEWLRDSPATNVTFVGPYSGTFPPPDAPLPPEPQPTTPGLDTRTWGGYAWDVDPSFFDQHGNAHFAHWGRQAAQFRYFIGDVVREYQPDYVLVALGFNDLAWISGPQWTIESMRQLLDNARAAKADAKFAVANVPQRAAVVGPDDLPTRTVEYNGLLEVLIGELTSEESPIQLVRLREAYACESGSLLSSRAMKSEKLTRFYSLGEVTGCPASHDGLHPNALGEFQIAKAFSQVLYEKYGLGNAKFTIPATVPLRPCWAPKNVRVVRTRLEDTTQPIKVTWDSFYGAFGYFVQARQKGRSWGGEMFTDIHQYKMFWPGNGQEWEVRVKTYCGDQQDHSPWSDVVSVRT
jgi:lysophospholipase L1-like esterase